jgi:hypothetical protein|tara:strand:+ start:1046 stop:1387 length:342 start_codon:yes stop_codon:yes gene_type:complete
MSLILDELRREIQKLKMQLSEQVEENIRLKGFKEMVMCEPSKFEDKRTYKNLKEHGTDISFENESRIKDDRGDADLTKKIDSLERENTDLKRDNKILADDNATLTNRLRQAGM